MNHDVQWLDLRAVEFSCSKATKCIHNLLCKHFNGIYIYFSYELLVKSRKLFGKFEIQVACKQWPRFLWSEHLSHRLLLYYRKSFFFFLNWNTITYTNAQTNGRKDTYLVVWMCKIFKYHSVFKNETKKNKIPKV